MNISISNIAWNAIENEQVVALMKQYNITGVDLAPSKIWTDPCAASDRDIAAVRQWWEERDVVIVGAQALHFGHPELQLFQSETKRRALFDFTAKMIVLCGKLGVSAMVFGSPKNRLRGNLPMVQAMAIAKKFFTGLGEIATAHNTQLCLEPNAVAYGCDFITTAAEGLELVQQVNHPGFRLHLDSGNMTMMAEDCVAAIKQSLAVLQHFHVSEPHLAPVGAVNSPVPHAAIASVLQQLHYQHWVSIEMTGQLHNQNAQAIEQAFAFMNVYQSKQ